MWKTKEEAKKTYCPFKVYGIYCIASSCAMWIYTENPDDYKHRPRSYEPLSHGINDGKISWEKGCSKEIGDEMLARGRCGFINNYIQKVVKI